MIVVKVGGSIADDCPQLVEELVHRDDVVLVHGFGPQTDAVAAQRGVEQRFVTSPTGARSRFTDDATLGLITAAASMVGRRLAGQLEDAGRPAAHLMGSDGILQAEAKPVLRDAVGAGRVVLVRGNRSGRVTNVDASAVVDVLARGATPVVTPLGADEAGPVSLDGDRAAAALAAALGAEALVLLTNVGAVHDGERRALSRLDRATAGRLIRSGVAQGGMMRKLVAAREAVAAGINHVVIASGTRARPIAEALDGAGTEVVA